MFKIAVWGVNDIIINVIRNEISPLKAQIVTFVDSNCESWERSYMNIPVMSPESLKDREWDYIIVAALSAYEMIKKTLIDAGISKEKIYPFITPQLTEYCIGEIDESIFDILDNIYFSPDELKKYVREYWDLYNTYSLFEAYLEDVDAWYNKSNLISHACGGVVNGEKLMYSNSREALEYSFSQNFKLIECDVLGKAMGKVILAHDYLNFYESKEKHYSMMCIEDVLSKIKEYPDINLLIDVKWNTNDEYRWYVEYIDNVIGALSKNDGMDGLKSQIIMEVYNEETIKIAYNHNFKMFFTQYRNEERRCFMKTANLCYKYGIQVVGFGVYDFFGENSINKFLSIFERKNIKIFCFSTDSMDDYKYLRSIGVKSIFTNWLTCSEVLS